MRLLIDTDTASDDAVALMMALRDPDVTVEAITLVAGNVPLDRCVQNALYVAELCGYDGPVIAGADAPLMRELGTATEVHGEDGMGDIGLPLTGRTPAAGWGPQAIVDLVRANPGELTLVTLGPLTNLAIALLWAPDIVDLIPRVVCMAGTGLNGPGNVSPSAEFNVWVDPEACRVVLRSGLPLEFVGWDISISSAVVTPERAASIRALDTPFAHLALDVQAVLEVYADTETELDGPDLPDPIAMAHVLDPSAATVKRVHVDVAIGPDPMRGALIVDRYGFTGGTPNLDIVTDYPEDRFFELLAERLG